MKLIIYLHLVLRLRMSGATPLLPTRFHGVHSDKLRFVPIF